MLEQTDVKSLFLVMQAHFGHKWTTTYDDPQVMRVAVTEWHRVLKGFRPEDIRRAIEEWAGDWPPSLPEFARLCLPPLETLGYAIEAEVRRREPQYHYVAQDGREEQRRRSTREKIRQDVEDEFIVLALRQVRDKGIESLLLESGDNNLLGEIA